MGATSVGVGTNTLVDVTIGGEAFDEALRNNLLSAASSTIGDALASEIGDAAREAIAAEGVGSSEGVSIEVVRLGQLMAHAALGCGTAAIQGADCAAGAVGGVASEVTGLLYFSREEQEALGTELAGLISDGEITRDEALRRVTEWQQKGYDLSRLAAALSSAALADSGADVWVGANAGSTAVENNVCGTGICIVAAVFIILEVVDKAILAAVAYVFAKALEEGDEEKATELGVELAIEWALKLSTATLYGAVSWGLKSSIPFGRRDATPSLIPLRVLLSMRMERRALLRRARVVARKGALMLQIGQPMDCRTILLSLGTSLVIARATCQILLKTGSCWSIRATIRRIALEPTDLVMRFTFPRALTVRKFGWKREMGLFRTAA